MELYKCDLTKDEFESILNSYFDNHKTGCLVKLTWIKKNYPDYLLNFLKNNYPEYSDIQDIDKYIYEIKHPNCQKFCDVCGKPLDRFNLKRGYWGGGTHRSCRAKWRLIKINSVDDIYSKYFNGSQCSNLVTLDSVIGILSDFKKDHPELAHYHKLKDLMYLLSRLSCADEIANLPKCHTCGKICRPSDDPFKYNYKDLMLSGCCYDITCSNKYRVQRMNETLYNKYGVINTSQLDSTKEKKKETALLKYGVINVFQAEEIKAKTKNTLLEKYGVDNISKSEEIKSKKEQTIIQHFGSMKEFIDYSFGSFCRKVGVHNVSQLDYVKEKKIMTFLKHYNKINCFQDEEIKKNIKEYWEKNPDKFKCAIAKSTINTWELKKNIVNQRKAFTGIEEYEVLNELENILGVSIYRQVSCMQYYIDGYIYDYNICIEYDEPDGHTYQSDVNYDKTRQNEIIDYLGCGFIRIKQIDWYMNKDEVIQNINRVIDISKKLNFRKNVDMTQSGNSAYRVKKVLKGAIQNEDKIN